MRRPAPRTAIQSGILMCAAIAVTVSCSKEPPPRTVVEFVEDPRLLEATMVRCAQNRAELRYTTECQNAREAVDRIASREEAAGRAELDAQSARKRDALRRAQQAAVDARDRAAELERQREEAEYLGQFEPVPQPLPASPESATLQPAGPPAGETVSGPSLEAVPEMAPEDAPTPAAEQSLESVREELQRRQQSDDQ